MRLLVVLGILTIVLVAGCSSVFDSMPDARSCALVASLVIYGAK